MEAEHVAGGFLLINFSRRRFAVFGALANAMFGKGGYCWEGVNKGY